MVRPFPKLTPCNYLTAMQQNLGYFDRAIRILLGAALAAALIDRHLLPTALHSWLVVLAVLASLLLFATGMLGYCPLYAWLGLNTRRSSRN